MTQRLLALSGVLVILGVGAGLAHIAITAVWPPGGAGGVANDEFPGLRLGTTWLALGLAYPFANMIFRRVTRRRSLAAWMIEVAKSFAR